MPRKFRQNGGGQFGAQLGAQDGKTLSKSLGGATGGQLGGDAGALVSDLQTQAQDKGQPGLGGPATGLQDAQNTQQAETQLQNDDAKARETRGEGVAQANQDAAADVKNFVAQQTQTGQGSSGGSGPSSAPSTQPATVGASGASASAAASGSGALGPNVPKALQPFVQDINAAAKQTGVPASLIGAQILQESGGDPHAVTTNPALGLPDTGLMQVDQATFQGLQKQYPSLLGGKSVSDPATNIMAGALLDAQLLKQNNGNTSAALTAYNGNATSGYANDVTAKLTALQNGTPVPGGFS